MGTTDYWLSVYKFSKVVLQRLRWNNIKTPMRPLLSWLSVELPTSVGRVCSTLVMLYFQVVFKPRFISLCFMTPFKDNKLVLYHRHPPFDKMTVPFCSLLLSAAPAPSSPRIKQCTLSCDRGVMGQRVMLWCLSWKSGMGTSSRRSRTCILPKAAEMLKAVP